MSLWGYLQGEVTAELVSADLPQALTELGESGVRFHRPVSTAPLTVQMTMDYVSWVKMQALAARRGDSCTCLHQRGVRVTLVRLRRRWLFWLLLGAMLASALYAPSRIWFLSVEGNDQVPAREILSAAEECGVKFWADASEIRSEQVKNHLLNQLPELQWAGVNIRGMSAVISVRERVEAEPVRQRDSVTNVVASRDGVIVSMSVLGGEAVCQVGQAVRQGELLVSGCIECPTHTQYTHADAEIYALTRRQFDGFCPGLREEKEIVGRQHRRISLIWGKKRIKIFGSSGISASTCDKMTQTRVFTLPGGFSLPLAVEIETYREYKPVACPVAAEDAQALLQDLAEQLMRQDMIAGEILQSVPVFTRTEDGYTLAVTSFCREMIARQKMAGLFEEVTEDDGTNHKRGESGGSD